MEDNLILKIEDLHKEYILGTVTGKTFQQDIGRLLSKNKEKDQAVNQKFVALDGIDLEIKKGEIVGIIGSNGAGKSTLLKIISQITAPTKGKVYLDGTVASMLEVGTGFHNELTGRQNIYLNGSILGMSQSEIDEKIDSIIEFSECQEFIDTPIKRYSSGMYVKLAFAVASHLDADIMIMDEVLAVGDVQFQRKCVEKMRDVAMQDGRTVLFVSHNMSTIRQLCKRCIVLNSGKIVFDGDIETAIKIYMGEDKKENQQEGNVRYYKEFWREGWLTKDDVRFTKAELCLETEKVKEDKIHLHLEWENHQKVDQLYIRVELWNDYGLKAAAIAENVYSGEADTTGSCNIWVDMGDLVNCKYSMKLVAFYKDPYGNIINLDMVPGLEFVLDRSTDSNILWDNESWGCVWLDAGADK